MSSRSPLILHMYSDTNEIIFTNVLFHFFNILKNLIMKTLKIRFQLFSLLILFISSAFLTPCEAQKIVEEHVPHKELKTNTLENEPLLKVVNGSLKIEGDKNKFLSSLNSSLLKESGLRTNLNTLKVERFEGKYYLVAQGDEYRTIMEIEDTSNKSMAMLAKYNVTCTTKSCASNRGCRPVAGLCLPCSGDCSRTISTGINGFQLEYKAIKLIDTF